MRTVEEMVKAYTELKSRRAFDSMYEEAKWQYQDMARGGDGGYIGFERNGETTCRGINYKGYPDTFFKGCYEMASLIDHHITYLNRIQPTR